MATFGSNGSAGDSRRCGQRVVAASPVEAIRREAQDHRGLLGSLDEEAGAVEDVKWLAQGNDLSWTV